MLPELEKNDTNRLGAIGVCHRRTAKFGRPFVKTYQEVTLPRNDLIRELLRTGHEAREQHLGKGPLEVLARLKDARPTIARASHYPSRKDTQQSLPDLQKDD